MIISPVHNSNYRYSAANVKPSKISQPQQMPQPLQTPQNTQSFNGLFDFFRRGKHVQKKQKPADSKNITANHNRAIKVQKTNYPPGKVISSNFRKEAIDLKANSAYFIDGNSKLRFDDEKTIDLGTGGAKIALSNMKFGDMIKVNAAGFSRDGKNRYGTNRDYYISEVNITKAGHDVYMLHVPDSANEVKILPNVKELHTYSREQYLEPGMKYIVNENASFSSGLFSCNLSDFNLDELSEGESITITEQQIADIPFEYVPPESYLAPVMTIEKRKGEYVATIPEMQIVFYNGITKPEPSSDSLLSGSETESGDATYIDFELKEDAIKNLSGKITDEAGLIDIRALSPTVVSKEKDTAPKQELLEAEKPAFDESASVNTEKSEEVIKENENKPHALFGTIDYRDRIFDCWLTYDEMGELSQLVMANLDMRIPNVRKYSKANINRIPQEVRESIPMNYGEDELAVHPSFKQISIEDIEEVKQMPYIRAMFPRNRKLALEA